MKRLIAAATAALLLAPLAARAEEAKKEEKKEEEKAPAVKFSGMVDAYFTANLTTSQAAPNELRAHDGNTGFRLNWAKLVAAMDPEPAGFRLDLAFGPESTFTTNDFVLQAYASLKLGPGVLDFGQFSTPFGFELYEAKDNWLYTRGLIYQFIVPTIHQGARYTFEVAEGISLQASIFNGWESPSDAKLVPYINTGDPATDVNNLSSYKTGHASIFYSRGAITAAIGGCYGKEPNAVDARWLVDGNVTYATGPFSVNVSGAYREEGDTDKRLGAGIMARYAVNDTVKVAARFEYLDDQKGAALGLVDGSGSPISGNAWITALGASYAVGANAELRAEVRYDKVSEDYFAKTDPVNTTPEYTNNAATAHLAAIAWF